MQSNSYKVYLNPYYVDGEISVLFAGSEHTEQEHNTGPTIRDYCLVHYVMDGHGTFQVRGKTYNVGRGDSFFIFPGELIQYTSDSKEPMYYRWLAFKGPQVVALIAGCGITPENPVVSQPENRRIPTLYYRIMDVLKQSNSNCDWMVGGYLRLLLAEYTKDRLVPHEDKPNLITPIEVQIDQAIRWLTFQYHQPISIEQLAQHLGYHRTHLSKMFKLYTGMSPMRFLMKIRMEQAKLLLTESLTIDQVASAVGFNDALYFSKKFKELFGCPPSEYRAKLR